MNPTSTATITCSRVAGENIVINQRNTTCTRKSYSTTTLIGGVVRNRVACNGCAATTNDYTASGIVVAVPKPFVVVDVVVGDPDVG